MNTPTESHREPERRPGHTVTPMSDLDALHLALEKIDDLLARIQRDKEAGAARIASRQKPPETSRFPRERMPFGR